MTFHVALCGASGDPSPVLPLPSCDHDDFLDTAVGRLLDGQLGDVLLLHETGRQADVRTAALRTVVDPQRIVPVAVDLPPLARAAVARWLARFGRTDVDLGTLVHAMPDLLSLVHVVGVVRSVARLDLSGVRLTHHAASLVPGVRFLVTLSPEPSVRVGLPERLELPGLASAIEVVAAGDPAMVERVTQRMVLPDVHDEGSAEQDPRARAWWGSRPLVEWVAVPADVDTLARELRGSRPRECRVCQRPVGETCPFCGCRSVVEVA